MLYIKFISQTSVWPAGINYVRNASVPAYLYEKQAVIGQKRDSDYLTIHSEGPIYAQVICIQKHITEIEKISNDYKIYLNFLNIV